MSGSEDQITPASGVAVRPPGKVRVRWLGTSDTELEFDGIRVDDAICQAVRKWLPSNNLPDRIVIPVVIEREGLGMSDEEAENHLRETMAKMRAVR